MTQPTTFEEKAILEQSMQTATVSSWTTERIRLNSAASLIDAASAPFSDQSDAAVRGVVDAECGQLARSVPERACAELHAAEAAAELAAKRLADSEATVSRAGENLQTGPAGGSWIKVVLWLVCTVACFAAEFVLTWTALCFVLDIPRMTVLGVLLGLAPPCGLAVLEVALARLFEEPWQRLRSAPASRRRWAANISMGLLLGALAVGNGATLVHLAKAREEAIKIQRDLTSDDSSPEQPGKFYQAAIDRAILWIGVCVCVDGSVFLLLALAEGLRLRDRKRLENALAAARASRHSAENGRASAQSRLKDCEEAARLADHDGSLAAERYRAHCHYLIAAKNAAGCEVPLEDIVNRSILRRFSAQATGGARCVIR